MLKFHGLGGDGGVQHAVFEGRDAAPAPSGYRHLFHKGAFGRVARLKESKMVLKEVVELVWRFVWEEDGAAAAAMAEAVLGGPALACCGLRPCGEIGWKGLVLIVGEIELKVRLEAA